MSSVQRGMPRELTEIDSLKLTILDAVGDLAKAASRLAQVERMKGSQVTAAFITPECRTNRGDDGAWNEAVDRLRKEYDSVCQGWGGNEKQPTLNLILTMERP